MSPYDRITAISNYMVSRSAVLEGPETNVEMFTAARKPENKLRFLTVSLANIGKGPFKGSDLLTTKSKDAEDLEAEFARLKATNPCCPYTKQKFDLDSSSHLIVRISFTTTRPL